MAADIATLNSGAPKNSPFFDPGPTASAENLAVLQLKRDQHVPIILHGTAENANGYAEGPVTNTRFGSFPHSTLLGLPWGSQVLASKVDTGSRGRKAAKRKRDDADESSEQDIGEGPVKAAITAGTGFAHLLPPTPESWTISLPHRTQVVYTPDYSYVLQRLRVTPGQTIIEAGAGSGSFTHASARAVFNGHPSQPPARKYGQVCSFEYHEPRVAGLKKELIDHNLSDIVRVSHRDVYNDGFNLMSDTNERTSPSANAIFLDLPAPWLALRHLSRRPLTPAQLKRVTPENAETTSSPSASLPFLSPLDSATPIHICTFSPCIEQVQTTVSALRTLGWTEIEMVEISQRRLDVRRERVGLNEEGLRGVQASAASVDEAVTRLRAVEGRFKEWHEGRLKKEMTGESRQERLLKIKEEAGKRKLFKEGNLVHRTEADVRTHTSYLVFAILPREWTEKDEEEAAKRVW